MATSIDKKKLTRTSIAGSDVLFDLYCQICDKEGRHVKAKGFCKNCNDYICDSCFIIHCRRKPSRHHVLLDKDHMSWDISLIRTRVSSDKCTDNCMKHPDKFIEYFCQPHQVLACSTCAIVEHSVCELLDYIPEVSAGITDSKELKDMFAALTTMDKKVKTIMKTSKTSKDDISDTKKLSSEAITSLKKFSKGETSLLNNLEKSIIVDTDKMNEISTNCSTAVSEIGNISNTLATLRNNKQNCNMYIALKRARVTLQSLQHSIEKAERDDRITENTFQCGSQLQDLKKLDLSGKISVSNLVHRSTALTSNVAEETAAIPLTPKLTSLDDKKTTRISYSEKYPEIKYDGIKLPVHVKEAKSTSVGNNVTLAKHVAYIDVRSKLDSKYCWITGSVVLGPSKLVVTDRDNEKVKVIDTQKHSLVSEIQLQSKPWDITLVKPDQLAVTLPDDKKIQYLDITQKYTLSKTCIISVNGVCRGIAYAKDRLVVSFTSPGKVEILTLNGDVQHTIAFDFTRQQLFTYPYYLALSPDGDIIYVSDWNTHTVTSLTTTGNVLSVYRNDQLVGPTGIAVAADGTVYVCGNLSRNVHMLTARFELIKVILTMEDIKTCLYSISYCKDNKQLYIGLCASNNIKVYQLT